MKQLTLLFVAFALVSCQHRSGTVLPPWVPYDESQEIAENADHPSQRMRFKRIQSLVLDKNIMLKAIEKQLNDFSQQDYERLKPLIYEQDIPTLQSHVQSGRLTYKQLTQWYLYRIARYENDRTTYLNAIIAINPDAVKEAAERDKHRSAGHHPVYGMPVLVKDNINVKGMPTTAGAHVLMNNYTDDAFIIENLRKHGAVILGKTNLSEWANFLFFGGPNGYSAVGGQTLNPYGRRKFDTGGSSSGSGVAMAANYAAAAIGTETSGSILSPSSQNSIVGLKPTVGLLSRGGIVPISSTYDTPGPMTRTVVDNAILLSAMVGKDPQDPETRNSPDEQNYWESLKSATVQGLRFGAIRAFMEVANYRQAVDRLRSLGAEVIEIEPESVDLDAFRQVLPADMKKDLPYYLEHYGAPAVRRLSVQDIIEYNRQDSLTRIPYGQERFAGMLKVDLTPEELQALKTRLHTAAVRYFEGPMTAHQLDAVLSINNRHARYAALARYPCLTVPMGYEEDGKPIGLTFIARPYEEARLLQMGYVFEQATRLRRPPAGYEQ